jgi:menaquinone-dependent protoporphyrinogen IX oxidase
MNIAIVYESNTGTTATAAQAMGREFTRLGHQCEVQSVGEADPSAVAKADLICIGAWVKGMLIFGQHPSEGTLNFIARLDGLRGKRAVVFCTYKIAAGSTLSQLSAAIERQGGVVAGKFQYRSPHPDAQFAQFAQTLC